MPELAILSPCDIVGLSEGCNNQPGATSDVMGTRHSGELASSRLFTADNMMPRYDLLLTHRGTRRAILLIQMLKRELSPLNQHHQCIYYILLLILYNNI